MSPASLRCGRQFCCEMNSCNVHGEVLQSVEFFEIYGWLIKIYGCFSAKLENCG